MLFHPKERLFFTVSAAGYMPMIIIPDMNVYRIEVIGAEKLPCSNLIFKDVMKSLLGRGQPIKKQSMTCISRLIIPLMAVGYVS